MCTIFTSDSTTSIPMLEFYDDYNYIYRSTISTPKKYPNQCVSKNESNNYESDHLDSEYEENEAGIHSLNCDYDDYETDDYEYEYYDSQLPSSQCDRPHQPCSEVRVIDSHVNYNDQSNKNRHGPASLQCSSPIRKCPLCLESNRPHFHHIGICPYLPDHEKQIISRARMAANILGYEFDDVVCHDLGHEVVPGSSQVVSHRVSTVVDRSSEDPDEFLGCLDDLLESNKSPCNQGDFHRSPESGETQGTDLPHYDAASPSVMPNQAHLVPFVELFHGNHCVRVNLVSGSTDNLISQSTVMCLGGDIVPTSQSVCPTDNSSPLVIIGKTCLIFTRDDQKFLFEGLVVESLSVAVQAGIPFMELHDVFIRPSKCVVSLCDGPSYSYGPSPSPAAVKPYASRLPASAIDSVNRPYPIQSSDISDSNPPCPAELDQPSTYDTFGELNRPPVCVDPHPHPLDADTSQPPDPSLSENTGCSLPDPPLVASTHIAKGLDDCGTNTMVATQYLDVAPHPPTQKMDNPPGRPPDSAHPPTQKICVIPCRPAESPPHSDTQRIDNLPGQHRKSLRDILTGLHDSTSDPWCTKMLDPPRCLAVTIASFAFALMMTLENRPCHPFGDRIGPPPGRPPDIDLKLLRTPY